MTSLYLLPDTQEHLIERCQHLDTVADATTLLPLQRRYQGAIISKNFYMHSLPVNRGCLVGVVLRDYPEKAVALPGHTAAFSHAEEDAPGCQTPCRFAGTSTAYCPQYTVIVQALPHCRDWCAPAGGLEALEAFFTHMPSDSEVWRSWW